MTVTAPDVSVWWDTAAVTAEALAQLRLLESDVDAGRVEAAVDPAGQSINQYLDRDPAAAWTSATVPVQALDAIVQVVVELYRRKDAPPTSIDGMLAGTWRPASADPLAGVRATLAPFKARRGVA